MNREKVVKAVEEAFDMYKSEYEGTSFFDETEWEQNKANALNLLKEQENSIPISWFEQYTRLKCSESWHNMALAIIETWKTVNNIPTQTNTQKNALDVR